MLEVSMWCVYRTTNMLNGKTYIGQHRYETLDDGYMGSGVILEQAIKKNGIDNFKKEILVSDIPSRKWADKIETAYITVERKRGNGEYNITDGGQGFCGHHTEVSKKKIGKSLIGNDRAKGKNIGNKNAKGNVLSEEVRKRMGMSRMGNSNNGVALIKCLETNETHRTREWIKLGYRNAYSVARGHHKSCKGFHFEYIK